MTAIAAAGSSSIKASTQLSVASVTTSADIQGRDVIATREFHVDGAAVLNGSLTCGGVNVMTSLSGKQAALTTSSNLSVASVASTMVASTTGMTITGGRGGVATNGAQLRVVSSTTSILTAPPVVYWGVNGEDHQCFEYDYLGFCHFWRSSAASAWSETSRVTSNNKWTF